MNKELIKFNMSVLFSPLELLTDGRSADVRESIEESLAQGNPAVEYIGTQLRDLCDELVLDVEAVADAYESASIDDIMKHISFDTEAITYTGAESGYVSFNVPCTFDADTFIARATEGKDKDEKKITVVIIGKPSGKLIFQTIQELLNSGELKPDDVAINVNDIINKDMKLKDLIDEVDYRFSQPDPTRAKHYRDVLKLNRPYPTKNVIKEE